MRHTMLSTPKPLLLLMTVTIGSVLFTQDASACAACFGQTDPVQQSAANTALLVLLGVLASVVAGLVFTLAPIVRATPVPPHHAENGSDADPLL